MAVSSLKLTNPEVVSMLRTKRQSLAGTVRQLLLDADRQRSGRKTPLNRCSNVELRHEVELRIGLLGPLDRQIEQFGRGNLPGPDKLGEANRVMVVEHILSNRRGLRHRLYAS